MGYAQQTGYIPDSIDAIMQSLMANVNAQFNTSYTTATFQGTNFYKYFYALAQRLQESEVKTSEIFQKLQQYFIQTNSQISKPQVTNPGIIQSLTAAGYVASVKKPIDADAGKIYICVNTDSGAGTYAATKLAINTLIKNITTAGCVTQGTEVSTIALSNGQSFDFKFNLANKIPIKLRLTTTLSLNNQYAILDSTTIKTNLFNNINARYSLGLDFEPQRYFNRTDDAPWASVVLLEWSTDGGSNWHSTVFNATYVDIYTFALSDITLVQN